MAKLTSLSDQVLLEMTSCAILGPSDLASLALVNKKLSRVANESLYKKFGERTAIEFAAENDSIGTLKAALYFGLDIHYDEHRALRLASKRGQLEAMSWLLSHGAPVDNALISGTFASLLNSPLYFALNSQQERAALLLIECGATLRFIVPSLHNRGDGGDGDDHNNIPTIADETALHMAARGRFAKRD
ncbi:hypothetical protein K445DRAFT_23938 [Daldinia sp. EC12]|nr:hypothetical protein K445DRAFT_23938 [Daldinia sp. EC12]